ncbi:MAG TPA: VWA domain-containing protein [Candidatus Thermoplasmatota archaeon]|nr:VWA domain-containing protein [Candidatus Thermoplasmatota archaeon]
MRTALPDCKDRADPFALSSEDRRELVRRIAEHGVEAIDQFVREREEQGDSAIAQKIRKLREALLAQADALRRRLAGEFTEREEALEAEYRARLAELQDRERMLRGDLDHLRSGEGAALEAALRANPVIGLALDADVAARAPWWRRALRWLARALRVLLFPILWLLRLITPARKQDRIAIALPAGALAGAGELYLSDAGFRSAVKGKLRAAPASERVRRAWERLLGREDYESLAQKAMAQMVAEEEQRARLSLTQRKRSMEETLADILERERQAATERAGGHEALEREREAEARRIEEALRSAPEAEVKEAIVDELKAAGLLRETGAGLLPTMQFMDRFAALVHQEESARGGSAGATGEYAEGEGHYLREPLRSAIEISRMDIRASLLRARTRHPRVRRLMEDDIVIYREERASLLNVVLIVDRSGSMEENGRMDAAKRAALALHHAVKAKNPRNRVDLLLMDTSLHKATLREVWETEPRGFTNTGAALRLARGLCAQRGRTLVYLVTDGLPEAYTKDGPAVSVDDGHGGLAKRSSAREDVAGHPEKAMAYAKEQARLLKRERGLAGFVMLLLEPKDEMYVKAAEALAKEAGGRVVAVDPGELARTLLKSFEARPTDAAGSPRA